MKDKHQILHRALRKMGTHNLGDIRKRIDNGNMQSWVGGNDSWAVTRIAVFPQMKVVEIVFYMGEVADIDGILAAIVNFAEEEGATSIRAHARIGWDPGLVKSKGFAPIATVYERKL